ncbi:MAG: methylmalonyl-CoA mutase family protein [Pseudomonadota bacterium]|nr:methylmalonyl-CoA mutase family protein [Pseudomonadota bacterium]
MPPPTLPLAAEFAPATRAGWLAAVRKTLKGAAIETLAGRTPDGLAVRPLYTAADPTPPATFPHARRDGAAAWDIRAAIAHPDPARANAQMLEDLAGGASSILIRIDPTGRNGVAVGSADGLARLLDGVMMDVAPVAFDAGFLGLQAAQWLAAAAKASPGAPLAFHLDPLSAFGAAGASPGPVEHHVTVAADYASRVAETYPRASLFRTGGGLVHEAGGSPGLELAVAAACAVAYARALVIAGMSADVAFGRIVLGLSVDGDVLSSIAKLRAARIVWAKISGACGAAGPARIEARSSRRMLTRADPWTNLVRLTAAGFAAAAGGADAIVLGAFTDALGLPSPLARRLARDTQLILMEEAHLGRVADPLAGAWAIEALADDLARAAWSRFTAIEAAGGIAPALASGMIAAEVQADRAALKGAIAGGEIKIVGVTDFVGAATGVVEIETRPTISTPTPDPRLPGPDSHCPALASIRLEELAA